MTAAVSRWRRLIRAVGLQPLRHRPPLEARFWFYSVAAYILPIVAVSALPAEGTFLDEAVWFLTLVPAFLLALHFGLRGAFVALLIGIAVILGVQITLTVSGTNPGSGLTIPVLIAYGALAISVGWLSEELHEHYEYALELQAQQRGEALGSMAAGIAHDFNNILTAMSANAELIAEEAGRERTAVQDELEQMQAAARRGAGIVRNLLGFSRRGMLNRRSLDLARVVEDQLQTLRRILPEEIEVRFHADEGLPPALADAGAVESILANLITNARDAMPYGGTLEVEVERRRLDREHRRRKGWGDLGEYLCLSVRDDGEGMDEEFRSRIFEPFFTGKEPGEGVGLGMAMVYGLMKQHRGFVDVESSPGRGTTVRAYFPLLKERAGRTVKARGREEPAVGGSETILLVEDEEPIRTAAQRILERLGYTVIPAIDGEEALELYEARGSEIDLILTDVLLPRLSGAELADSIAHDPDAPPVLLMSGYPARTLRESIDLDPSVPFLQKPWTVEELTRAVRRVLDRGARPRSG